MTMNTSSALSQSSALISRADSACYRFVSDDDAPEPARKGGRSEQSPASREDLPYKVELWDESRSSVEQVLAVTANGSIGFAAYYAATREYPDRYVTLRHKNSIVSRSNTPQH